MDIHLRSKAINLDAFDKATKFQKFYWKLCDGIQDISPRWLRLAYKRIWHFWYEEISTRINPRQKWLTNVIPRRFSDKTQLTLTVLYAMIIHFVEEEKCFETVNWADSWDGGAEFALKLKEVYDWAKEGRVAFEKRIEEAYPKNLKFEFKPLYNPDGTKTKYLSMKRVGEHANKTFEELYGEVNRLEMELQAKDSEYLTWIVQNRQFLWT